MEKFGIWFGGTEIVGPCWFHDENGQVFVFDSQEEAQATIDNYFAYPGEEITVKVYDGDASTIPGGMWLVAHSE